MENHQLPYKEFSHLIEFVLCFPGTSAPLERVFAKANKIWTEFYDILKKKPSLLQKISTQEKYDFKQPKAIAGSSPGAMSIDSIPEEEEI